MIDYEFVYRYREIKDNQSEALFSYVKDSIIKTIKNIFTQQKEYDKTALDIVLSNMDFEIFRNGHINVYFESIYHLDWLKTRCSCFENNIKITLNSLGETIRFIFNTEVD